MAVGKRAKSIQNAQKNINSNVFEFMSSSGNFIIFCNDDVGIGLSWWWRRRRQRWCGCFLVFHFMLRYATEITLILQQQFQLQMKFDKLVWMQFFSLQTKKMQWFICHILDFTLSCNALIWKKNTFLSHWFISWNWVGCLTKLGLLPSSSSSCFSVN